MIVTENQLDEWVRGNARDAQGVVVELIWRLVAASCPRPTERRFPLGDSIDQHGPDGILDVALAFEPFVPEGRSYWEIGTGLRAGDKATSDYRGLVSAVPEGLRLGSTFVFVTPLSGRRGWEYDWTPEHQGAWIEERRARREWRDVRVVDGTKLIDWIHQFPPVELWLAQRTLGASAQYIETPEQRWSLVRSIGEPPPLTPKLFLSGREEASVELKNVLLGTTVQLKLTTHFPDQVVDFVAAYLSDLDAEARADAAGRWLIVSDVGAWNAMVSQQEKLVLIADSSLDLRGDSGTRMIQKARKSGHAVIFGGPAGGVPDPASAALRAPRAHQVREALEQAGYSEERARTLTQQSGGNLGSLLRCLQNLSLLPEWAERSSGADLAIAAALGSWNDAMQGDREVVRAIAGKEYGEWIAAIREIARRPGTPLNSSEGVWVFAARWEGWYTLGPRLHRELVESLAEAAGSVLAVEDPMFELASEDRYLAAIKGKILPHSGALRTGLADFLALLGSQPTALSPMRRGAVEALASRTVHRLLDGANWKRWASLSGLLPVLAEAAPSVFLESVERAATAEDGPILDLFRQETGGIFGHNYMSGVLWALETLAWDSEHFARAVACLGVLAEIDPGGSWGNRPIHSLTSILLPWFPQTCAVSAARESALRALLVESPRAAWRVLLSLLPGATRMATGTRRPAWRASIPEDWTGKVRRGDLFDESVRLSRLALTVAMANAKRLQDLVDHIDEMPAEIRAEFCDYVGTRAATEIPAVELLALWSRLETLITRHRKYRDADWALEPAELETLEKASANLMPKDPFLHHQRFFSGAEFELFEENEPFEVQQEKLEGRRRDALRELEAFGGSALVRRFALEVRSAWNVGFSYASVAGPEVDREFLPELLGVEVDALAQFLRGFVWGRFVGRGWPWVDGTDRSTWSPARLGEFFSVLSFDSETWSRVAKVDGVEQEYWSRCRPRLHGAVEGMAFAAERFLLHGRPYAALTCLHHVLSVKDTPRVGQVVRALLSAAGSTDEPHHLSSYEISNLIRFLQSSEEVAPDDLFRVEWAYLPLLEREREATAVGLERRLAEDASFFCSVIRLVFRSKNAPRDPDEPSEEQQRIATNAYRLLSNWSIPPGMDREGVMDSGALTRWLDVVRFECSESGHLEIALTMFGHVMAHAPRDPSGLWIHRAAAAVLNANDADDIRDGFRTELFNSRGAHWVDPDGAPERELAQKYRGQAEEAEHAGYARLGSVLRDLADTYERQAEWIASRELLDE